MKQAFAAFSMRDGRRHFVHHVQLVHQIRALVDNRYQQFVACSSF
jgi:hypothetical protein